MKPSKEFLVRLKLNSVPMYRICQQAGIDHTTISRLINGITPIRENDRRIIAVGAVIGLMPVECFEFEKEAA